MPRSYSSSTTTHVNPPKTLHISSPIVEEKRKSIVHVISVQEFEMSRAKIVIRPTNARPSVPKKDENHGLKKLLSTKVRSKRSTAALERVAANM